MGFLDAVRRQKRHARADALEDRAMAQWGGKEITKRLERLRKD